MGAAEIAIEAVIGTVTELEILTMKDRGLKRQNLKRLKIRLSPKRPNHAALRRNANQALMKHQRLKRHLRKKRPRKKLTTKNLKIKNHLRVKISLKIKTKSSLKKARNAGIETN